jgi:hypothetical protein
MLAPPLLAIVAVLAQDRVVFADTGAGRILRQVVLPAPAVAIFAAPDGRVLLPLEGSDETAVVSPVGPTERWRGRLFPVFFDEADRMHITLSELLVVVSYPDRLPILRVPVAGMKAPWRTISTSNGLMVAICAAPPERRLMLVVAEPGAMQREVALAGEPRALAMGGEGQWVAVGLADSVQAALAGEESARAPLPIAGSVRALAASADSRDVLVGTADGSAGRLFLLRVNAKASGPGLKEYDSVALPGPVTSVAAAGDTVIAVAGDALVVLAKHGRKVAYQMPIPGARQVAVLPAQPTSALPLWSEPPAP